MTVPGKPIQKSPSHSSNYFRNYCDHGIDCTADAVHPDDHEALCLVGLSASLGDVEGQRCHLEGCLNYLNRVAVIEDLVRFVVIYQTILDSPNAHVTITDQLENQRERGHHGCTLQWIGGDQYDSVKKHVYSITLMDCFVKWKKQSRFSTKRTSRRREHPSR